MSGDVYYFRLGGLNVPVNGKMQQILGLHDINSDQVLDEQDFSMFLDRNEVLANAYLGAAKSSGYSCSGIKGRDLKIVGGAAIPIRKAYSSFTRGDCERLIIDAGFSNTHFDLLVSEAVFLNSGIGKLVPDFHFSWVHSGVVVLQMPCDIPPELGDAISSILYKGAYVYFHTTRKEICDSDDSISGVVKNRNYLISRCSIDDVCIDEFVPLLPFETEKIEIYRDDLPYSCASCERW